MHWRQLSATFILVVGLALALAGCRGGTAKTLTIAPREATADEVAQAVARLPGGFREGLAGADADVAKQLGLRVWAFDFHGGPFGCWIDIDEEGQKTAASPHARNAATRIG